MTGKPYRTASEVEIQRELERARRAKLALDNHKRPGKTHGAKVRDALGHAHSSNKKPGTVTSGYRVSEICRDADDEEKYTPLGT